MESERARRAEHRAKLEIAVGYLNADMKAHSVRWFLDPGKLEAALITAGILPDDRPPTPAGAGAGASAQGAPGAPAIPDPPKPRIVVGVEGGVVQGAWSSVPVELTVRDYDTDGIDASDIIESLDGDYVPCYPGCVTDLSKVEQTEEEIALFNDEKPSEADRAVESARKGGYIVDDPKETP